MQPREDPTAMTAIPPFPLPARQLRMLEAAGDRIPPDVRRHATGTACQLLDANAPVDDVHAFLGRLLPALDPHDLLTLTVDLVFAWQGIEKPLQAP